MSKTDKEKVLFDMIQTWYWSRATILSLLVLILHRRPTFLRPRPRLQNIVTIRGRRADHLGVRRFTRFFLNVENKNRSLGYGHFEIVDDIISKFSERCPHMVIEQSQIPKEKISVIWTSPYEGSGCVHLSATIMESPDIWYTDGELNKVICQDPKAVADNQGPILEKCCACDEAKYEVAFEGLWTRNSHPKNYPSNPHATKFSDVIGASHTYDYRFWDYGSYASDGLRMVAESGVTRVLESELKNRSEEIRTIIKARGISYPNITGKTFAVFRVDQKHHVISLVSMIEPSPDWIVGVAGLELCLPNCSWIESKELNLYPYDVGTDDGISYESTDSLTDPQEPIRRITESWPNDPGSPFFPDPGNTEVYMKPMAKLYIKRQRIYEKQCESSSSMEEPGPITKSLPNILTKSIQPHAAKTDVCETEPRGDWSQCSVTCGRGYQLKQRYYKHPKLARQSGCLVDLTDRRKCVAEISNCYLAPPDPIKCKLTSWSEWTLCTKKCGRERRVRSREYRHRDQIKECSMLKNKPKLEDTKDCNNPKCPGVEALDSRPVVTTKPVNISISRRPAPIPIRRPLPGSRRQTPPPPEREQLKCADEHYTPWTSWGPCTATCGKGTRQRSRQIKIEFSNLGLRECQYETTTCLAPIHTCAITIHMADEICSQPMEPGGCNDNNLRYYYDKQANKCLLFTYTGCGGNANIFKTLGECKKMCMRETSMGDSPKKNYNALMTTGVTHDQPAPKRRTKIKRAKCDANSTSSNVFETRSLYNGNRVDCVVSEWSEWTRCYGCRGYTTTHRTILVRPQNGGRECPEKLMRKKKCHKVVPECSMQKDGGNLRWNPHNKHPQDKESVNCKVTSWSEWTPCTTTCGESLRRRMRHVKIPPQGLYGKLCPPLAEIEDCGVPEC